MASTNTPRSQAFAMLTSLTVLGSPGLSTGLNANPAAGDAMKVGSMGIAADPAKLLKARAPAPRRVKTPNCTHIDMDRSYGRDQLCYVCGREPSLGFLYVCRQDLNGSSPIARAYPEGSCDGVGLKSELRRSLEDIGLSESVIVNAERGGYTDAQLQTLKKQKLELRQAIEDAIQGSQINSMAVKLKGSLTSGLSNTDGTSGSVLENESATPRCAFQACHACRPYYKDRIYLSLPAVFFSTSIAPLSSEEVSCLPVKNPRNLRQIGLLTNRLPPSPPRSPDNFNTSPSTPPTSTDLSSGSLDLTPSRGSVLTFKTSQTDLSVLHRTKRPRRRFYNLGNKSSSAIARDLSSLSLFSRDGLKSTIQGIFKHSKDKDLGFTESNITLPLPRSGTARNLTVGEDGERIGEFDVGSLRRVRRQKERADLRNGTTRVGGFETGPRFRMSDYIGGDESNASGNVRAADGDTESTGSNYTVYTCAGKGGEVEVSGGVALTEEAIETHTPDILDTSIGRNNKVESIMAPA